MLGSRVLPLGGGVLFRRWPDVKDQLQLFGRQEVTTGWRALQGLLQDLKLGHSVHILVAAPPQISPAKLMQFIKGRSSRLLQHVWVTNC